MGAVADRQPPIRTGLYRTFLRAFALQGESQEVARILTQFSIRYHQDNPTKFANSCTRARLALFSRARVPLQLMRGEAG